MLKAKDLKGVLLIVLAVAYLLAFLVSNLLLLDKDLVNVDEPWISDAALHFSQTGHFTPEMFQGKHYNLDGQYRWSIQQLLEALVFKIGGFGLYQARLLSFVSGLAALLFVFLLGRQLYDADVGVVAVVLFAFAPIYQVSRSARAEMLLTVFVLAALYAFIVGVERRNGWLLLASGLMSVLACAVHLNGLIVICSIGVLFLTHFREAILRKNGLASYLLGLLWGGVTWILVYGVMLTEASGAVSVVPTFNSAADYLTYSLIKLESYVEQFHGGPFHNVSIMSALILLSLVWIAVRRNRSDTLILTVAAVFVAFFSFVSFSANYAYLIFLFPFLFLAVAATSVDLARRFWTARQNPLLYQRLAAVAMLVGALGWATVRAANEGLQAYQAQGTSGYDVYVGRLKAYIPPNVVVMGQPTWFYGFYQQPYYADRYFAWITQTSSNEVKVKLGRTFEEAIRKAGVEYLIIDSQLVQRMSVSRDGINSLPIDEVVPFLEDQCVLVGAVDEGVYGFTEGQKAVTRIYRVKSSVRSPG